MNWTPEITIGKHISEMFNATIEGFKLLSSKPLITHRNQLDSFSNFSEFKVAQNDVDAEIEAALDKYKSFETRCAEAHAKLIKFLLGHTGKWMKVPYHKTQSSDPIIYYVGFCYKTKMLYITQKESEMVSIFKNPDEDGEEVIISADSVQTIIDGQMV